MPLNFNLELYARHINDEIRSPYKQRNDTASNGKKNLLDYIIFHFLFIIITKYNLILKSDDDEIYNSPNLHSEEQIDLEISEGNHLKLFHVNFFF